LTLPKINKKKKQAKLKQPKLKPAAPMCKDLKIFSSHFVHSIFKSIVNSQSDDED